MEMPLKQKHGRRLRVFVLKAFFLDFLLFWFGYEVGGLFRIGI
jgi:hypothetical protein